MKSKKQIQIDNVYSRSKRVETFDAAKAVFAAQKNETLLFSRGKIASNFFTEDSKLYITPRQQKLITQGVKLDMTTRKWDALSSRVARTYQKYHPTQKNQKDILWEALEKRYAHWEESLQNGAQTVLGQFTMARLWNMSIVGAILVGMFTMSMIYRYLGQGAAAGVATRGGVPVENELVLSSSAPQVLGVDAVKNEDLTDVAKELSSEELSKQEFAEKAQKLVKGYPIEKMLPYILEKDRKTASFLIAIAKKESAWGVHAPVLDGQDCYNYWGYRAQRKLMGTGGHTCFNSRKDAVDTVGKRINQLVNEQEKNTAAEMIVWKCGSSCAGHGAYDVQKWISDVDTYYKKLN